jgi:hypothetical protein
MSEEGRIKYFSGMKQEDVWKMAEGNPETKTEVNAKVEVAALDPEQREALLSLLK